MSTYEDIPEIGWHMLIYSRRPEPHWALESREIEEPSLIPYHRLDPWVKDCIPEIARWLNHSYDSLQTSGRPGLLEGTSKLDYDRAALYSGEQNARDFFGGATSLDTDFKWVYSLELYTLSLISGGIIATRDIEPQQSPTFGVMDYFTKIQVLHGIRWTENGENGISAYYLNDPSHRDEKEPGRLKCIQQYPKNFKIPWLKEGFAVCLDGNSEQVYVDLNESAAINQQSSS